MKIKKENLIKFFDRKGFYIVLFLCVVVVGATAVYVTNNNLKKLAELKKAQQEEINSVVESNWDYEEDLKQAKEEKTNDNLAATMTQGPKEDKGVVSSNDTADKKEEKTNTAYESPAKSNVTGTKVKAVLTTTQPAKTEKQIASSALVLLKPVDGEIILEFAKDKLVYSKTLDEWTTHKGIDIKAPVGSPVLAAMEGIVTKVYKDERLGNTVDIKSGKFETRYANLEEDISVKEGDKVEKGQQIGKVGKSAKFEIAEEPHVHFELLENGVHIDPSVYFK
ncbi:peptidase M23 [Thermoanaerobacter kivui]|uniref:Peptidase M23 n=1 Tax=Thermoanaerobacter kivui TaxID=2325 RepID=A0A097ANH8_THEKI|nr:M23 family metallopeptidase [Thermoanaerobacter kivui]AIS51374.1 peptidase M23 [Thermoanaerobacter kivui]